MIGAILAKRSVPAWFDAMNRHDLDALLKDYAEDVVMVYPGDVEGVSGTTIGKPALRDWYQRYFEQFPVVDQRVRHIAVSNIFDMVGNNGIAVDWEVDVVNRDGLEVYNEGVSIITSRWAKPPMWPSTWLSPAKSSARPGAWQVRSLACHRTTYSVSRTMRP